MGQKSYTTRRTFLTGVAGTAVAAGVTGCIEGTEDDGEGDGNGQPSESPTGRLEDTDKYPRMEVASVDELSEGDVMTFRYPLDGHRNFLTKLGEEAWKGKGPDGDIVAFNSTCTHQGCNVGSNVEPENSVAGPCPCHYTTFDLSKAGLSVTGPATADLPQIRLEVEDGTVYATGVDGLIFGYRHNLRDGELAEGIETPEESDD
ncbi:MAG: arsenate reductase (azurin) small subunit [Halobacteriales archaeon]|nr:arsenate reductase (azurin) small subunit [Halobacteriales archaeon]